MFRFLAKFIFGRNNRSENNIISGETYTIRNGRSVKTDAAFDAWTSGSLEKMMQALEVRTNPIDRHFLLMGIVEAAYKKRLESKYAEICERIARLHIAEFPDIAPVLKQDMGGHLPRVTTFQYYATLLTERMRFDEAIAVCTKAIEFGLHDGTIGGFAGRIARIRRKVKR